MNRLVLELASLEAGALHRRWPAVERDDIRQEILVWALERPEMAAKALEAEDLGEDEGEARKALRLKLRDAGAQYCKKQERDRRRERAAALGYETTDEIFYGLPYLRELVEHLFAHGLAEKPPVGRADATKRIGDPAEGGTYLTSLLDVQRGLTLISSGYLHRLWDRLGVNAHLTDEEYGWLHGLSEAQVRGRLRVALRALQRALGGASPWNRGPTPKDQKRPVQAA
jgi:hypothetical protein